MRYQYRVTWRTWHKRGDEAATGKLRYAAREASASAESTADRLREKAEEDHCECESPGWECGYCQGTEFAPSDIAITRRTVGPWEAVSNRSGSEATARRQGVKGES